jgi:hypothetical protein
MVINYPNPNVWEVFLQDRRDIGVDINSITVVKDIPVAFETKFYAMASLSDIKYAEIDISEAIGTVNIDIYYSPKRGVYKKIASRQVVSTVGSIISNVTIPITFPQYLPQRRTIKTVNECLLATDNNLTIETPYTRNWDRYFSFLIKWTGQMSISEFRVYPEPQPEQMDGASEASELTDRYIRPTGDGAISSLTSPPAALTQLPILNQTSGFISTVTPRWSEGIYQSLT